MKFELLQDVEQPGVHTKKHALNFVLLLAMKHGDLEAADVLAFRNEIYPLIEQEGQSNE
jgi:hypothetical protein